MNPNSCFLFLRLFVQTLLNSFLTLYTYIYKYRIIQTGNLDQSQPRKLHLLSDAFLQYKCCLHEIVGVDAQIALTAGTICDAEEHTFFVCSRGMERDSNRVKKYSITPVGSSLRARNVWTRCLRGGW